MTNTKTTTPFSISGAVCFSVCCCTDHISIVSLGFCSFSQCVGDCAHYHGHECVVVYHAAVQHVEPGVCIVIACCLCLEVVCFLSISCADLRRSLQTYAPATFHFHNAHIGLLRSACCVAHHLICSDTTIPNVGIKIKGLQSRTALKKGFSFNFQTVLSCVCLGLCNSLCCCE